MFTMAEKLEIDFLAYFSELTTNILQIIGPLEYH